MAGRVILLPVFGGLVAEGLNRLYFKRFQVNDEHTLTVAASVAATARGWIVKLGYA